MMRRYVAEVMEDIQVGQFVGFYPDNDEQVYEFDRNDYNMICDSIVLALLKKGDYIVMTDDANNRPIVCR